MIINLLTLFLYFKKTRTFSILLSKLKQCGLFSILLSKLNQYLPISTVLEGVLTELKMLKMV